MSFRKDKPENNTRTTRKDHGRDHLNRKELKLRNFLSKLNEKVAITKRDAFYFLQKTPPSLDKAESEQVLNKLTKQGSLEFDGRLYIITEKGMNRTAQLKRISGYLDSFLFDPQKAPIRASEVGVASNSVLASLAILVGILSRSLALSTEGADSALDVFTSIVIWAGIRRGRERVSALFSSLAMTLSGAFLAYRSFNDLSTPSMIGFVLPAIVVAIIAMAVDYVMMLYKHFVGKRTGTLSLVADAYHNKTDVIAAFGVLVGILGSTFGFLILDPAAGILVSLIIISNGAQLIRECVRSLSNKEVNWSKYSMRYEKTLEHERLSMAEQFILEALRDKKLSRKEILYYLKQYDPLSFIYSSRSNTQKSLTFTPRLVSKVLAKLESQKTIKCKDGRYSLSRASLRKKQ